MDGVCVGIEKNTREIILNNEKGPSQVHNSVFTEVTILSNDNMLKSFSLEKIKNVLILNSTVAREVNEALRKSFLARQQEPEDPRRELTVFLAGQDARKVRVSTSLSTTVSHIVNPYYRSLTSYHSPLGTPHTVPQSPVMQASR